MIKCRTNLDIRSIKNWLFVLLLLVTGYLSCKAGFLFIKSQTANVLSSKTEVQSTTQRIDLPSEMAVTVSANIGGYMFDLEGLTSPQAKVDFYSSEGNLEISTIADNDGIFRFQSVVAPTQTGDFCFLSYDIDGIANNPLCFSPPPANTQTTISGIILSPTISISKSIFRQNDSVESRGRTFPNAKIEIFLFEKEQSWLREFFDVIVPAALAREGPKLKISADEEGIFSFNLPTQKSTKWRIFAGPKTDDGNQTAQSNVLEFSALSWWQWAIMTALKWLSGLLKGLFSFLLRWEVIIISLTVATTILIIKIRKAKL